MGHNSVGMINVIRSMNYVNIAGFMVLESENMVSLSILNIDRTNNKKTVVELFGKACSKIGFLCFTAILQDLYMIEQR